MESELCRRMGIPVDDTDPTETFRRLMATRNEWKLYRRKCDKTREDMIAAYPAGVPFPVYSSKAWWGDDWDATSFGREFDFERPFFEQFAELQRVVPREGTTVVRSENCDFNSHTRESRNCYMNSLMVRCEDVYYSYWMVGCHNVMDSMFTHDSTLCFWCSDVHNGYQCVLVESARDCSDCYFSFELRNCNHCIFSNNLVNKSYYAFNKPCTNQSMNLPLPRHCPSCRHQYRFRFKNSYLLHTRRCEHCKQSIQSSYAPDALEQIYCEACYLKAVY